MTNSVRPAKYSATILEPLLSSPQVAQQWTKLVPLLLKDPSSAKLRELKSVMLNNKLKTHEY
jgi:hypothetical protein